MWQLRTNLYLFLSQHGFVGGQDLLLATLIFILILSFLAGARSLAELLITQLEDKLQNGRFKIWLKIPRHLHYSVIFLVGIFFASFCFTWPEKLINVFDTLCVFIFVVILINVIRDFITNSIQLYFMSKPNVSKEAIKTVTNFSNVTSLIILWIIAVLIFLQFSSIDTGALLSGLGVASIIAAFGLQSVLKDMLAFFSIYVDRSFSVGDYIVFDNIEGTIKEIRLRTTKITALKGNDIIIPNDKLTSGIIENYNRLPRRRVSIAFDIDSDTSPENLRAVITNIQSRLINDTAFMDKVDVKTTVFDLITDQGLTLKVIYYFKGGNYMEHLEYKEKINFAILEVLRQNQVRLVQLHQFQD